MQDNRGEGGEGGEGDSQQPGNFLGQASANLGQVPTFHVLVQISKQPFLLCTAKSEVINIYSINEI